MSTPSGPGHTGPGQASRWQANSEQAGLGTSTTGPPRHGPLNGALKGLRTWSQGWQHLVFLVLNLLTSLVAVVIALCIILGAALLPVLGVGALLLSPALWCAWLFGRAELARLEAFTGATITPSPLQARSRLLHVLGLTPTHWRAAAYCGLHALWGLFIGSIVASLSAVAVALLALPLYAGSVPEQSSSFFSFLPLSSTTGRISALVVALGLLLLLPLLARALTWVDIQLARRMLGLGRSDEIAALADKVETLTVSRTETVDSVESERRRIERDLHDGPQQRLVAIAMDLGMARERLASDPDGARDLLNKAHAASKEAIVEMRHVARGITPPILADRGLDAAVSALAVRSAVPVRVDVRDIGRLDPTTEAIGYYCVSELLTNVAKHSGASSATVHLHREGTPAPCLVIHVEDDGVGGADPGRGTGLLGLRQRVRSVDGTIRVDSPHGGPTQVTIHLPHGDTPPHPAPPPPAHQENR